MIELDIAAPGLKALRDGWAANHKRSVRRAFRGEGFRLRHVMQQRFASGIGTPRAPLTRETAKAFRGQNKALAAIGRRIAYTVTEAGDYAQLWVGPGQWKRVAAPGDGSPVRGNMRTHVKALPVQMLEDLALGRHRTVTREHQQWIAYKLRQRMGEPVRNPRRAAGGGKTWEKRRSRYRAGRRAWKPIPAGWMPRVGTPIDIPARDWVREITAHERRRSVAYVARLYAMQMAGERWGRGMWWTQAGFRDLLDRTPYAPDQPGYFKPLDPGAFR